MAIRLHHGDCLDVLPTIKSESIDAVICDPPYPEMSRDYGRMTEADWHRMMRGVVAECRRVLTPKGSAVFVLQPNSERVGRMRPWLWEFMAWTAREWNQVQDAWWWNISAIPEAHSIQGRLMRPSLKACVWLGEPDCYRNQDDVLWAESDRNATLRRSERLTNLKSPGGHHKNEATAHAACEERGGVLPFNVLPMGGGKSAGVEGHGAGTPRFLADWWVRYITKPGDTVLDPFSGSGTIPLAAHARGRNAEGIEKMDKYHEMARRRADAVASATPLLSDATV